MQLISKVKLNTLPACLHNNIFLYQVNRNVLTRHCLVDLPREAPLLKIVAEPTVPTMHKLSIFKFKVLFCFQIISPQLCQEIQDYEILNEEDGVDSRIKINVDGKQRTERG